MSLLLLVLVALAEGAAFASARFLAIRSAGVHFHRIAALGYPAFLIT